ncbi:carbohydrate-binding module family 50 protein [Patellaria atrata CBS 101060]|uniref:Carbohydrate-binding module family 50 protein n=1 Tax=Patellaria atrata CBS 101060 TaxID=1346257 RepID=A0A9P4VRJ5_9PEZI|nr:carbohydrate-binding module family 50 protein [Patellaria atrata CBS 101060]
MLPKVLAAGSAITLVSGAPTSSIYFPSHSHGHNKIHNVQKRTSGSYLTTFGGDGSSLAGWPGSSSWIPFDSAFEQSRGMMRQSCSQFGVPNNSDGETNDIKDAINIVSSETGVDKRFILAIMMQESNGCVRAPTTSYSHRNPGLMQDHDGAATCNENGVQNPCPKNTIIQMIRDGTAGTPAGDGLKQLLGRATGSGDQKFYQAARMYNSGSLDPSGNLGLGVATHCYASDVANRLTGWFAGPSGCDPNSVGQLTGTVGGVIPSTGSGDTAVTPGTGTQQPPATESPPETGNSGSGERYPGASQSCRRWYTVQSGDWCEKVEQKAHTTLEKLLGLNSGLQGDCSNLWLGYSYCVE